ncbi:hypothetical protein GALL_375890 [mine drainage metagenome]|uniref:Uncharacterized protein n=1 Tax=mine drainage metagenome TaxID=410659 RepID=A0A1J5QB88_9ZZZZ
MAMREAVADQREGIRAPAPGGENGPYPPWRRSQRLIAVVLFLGLLLAIFELSGLRQHLSLVYLQQLIVAHRLVGLLAFILLFALGNLI